MGFRLKANNFNAMGHLIEGNVSTFLDHLLLDNDILDSSIDYLNQFLSDTSTDFISSNQRSFNQKIAELNHSWPRAKEKLEYLRDNDDKDIEVRKGLLKYFKDLSNLFSRFEYKFLILPGFEKSEFNQYLIEEENLIEWLSTESPFSYLIIQLKKLPDKEQFQVFDSFEHYPLALERIDEWPGILCWENLKSPYYRRDKNPSRGLFIPLINKDDLRRIFEKLSFEKTFFNSLRKEFGHRRNENIVDILHLSDIHVGTKNEGLKLRRLFHILQNYKLNYHGKEDIITLISGDLVDSPTEKNYLQYKEFESRLGFEKFITVLGNHDYNSSGFIVSGREAKNTIQRLSDKKQIDIIESHKLIIIRINSNIDGELAQGKVGIKQLSELGNELDLIPGLKSYCIIAMLHHHPFELERPEWMKKALYEKILGDFLINNSLKLKDSKLLIDWLKGRKITFVLHGHKHIPLLFKKDNLNVISAGSSTGVIKHCEKDKTFLTYNVIKYDIDKKRPVSASIIYEDLLGSSSKNYQMVKYSR